MNNSDGNCFFFVNSIPIKSLKLSKNLLNVVSSYDYDSETIKKVLITEEDVFKFFNFFENNGFYFKKYLMKYVLTNKTVPKFDAKKEKSIVKNTLILILYFLEFRKIQQKNENRKKKLEAFIDDYILRTGRILAKKISMKSFDIFLQFLLFLSLTKIEQPTVEEFKTFSIENLFILKILFKLLNFVFIEDCSSNENFYNSGIPILKKTIEFLLLNIIGNREKEDKNKQEEQIFSLSQLSNRFLLSHYYHYSSELISLSNLFKHIELNSPKIEEIKNLLLQLISNTFSQSLNFHSFITPLSQIVQQCYLDIDYISIDALKREIDLTSFLVLLLQNLTDSSRETLTTGFYIKDSSSKISVSDLLLGENFSILFSFYFVPKKEQDIYPIFSFKSNESPHQLNCLIKEKEDSSYGLFINEILVNIILVPFRVYCLSLSRISKTTYKVMDLESTSKTEEIKIKEIPRKKKFELRLGYNENSAFNGIIGHIVYTKNYLIDYPSSDKQKKEKEEKNRKKIQSKYISQYAHSIISKQYYSNEKNNNKLLEKDLDEDEWIIHPSMFQFIPFNENFNKGENSKTEIQFKVKNESGVNTITISSPFHKNFYSFCSSPFSINLLDNDGLSFILLLMEYYHQIILRLNTKIPNDEGVLQLL